MVFQILYSKYTNSVTKTWIYWSAFTKIEYVPSLLAWSKFFKLDPAGKPSAFDKFFNWNPFINYLRNTYICLHFCLYLITYFHLFKFEIIQVICLTLFLRTDRYIEFLLIWFIYLTLPFYRIEMNTSIK